MMTEGVNMSAKPTSRVEDNTSKVYSNEEINATAII